MWARILRQALIGLTSLITIIAMLALVVLVVLPFFWGTNQEYTPEYVEHNLTRGMTLDNVSYNLGKIDDARRETLKGGGYRLVLSRAGIGAWFAPQYEVWLEFDRSGRLSAGYATVVYQIDEYDMRLRLDDPRSSR